VHTYLYVVCNLLASLLMHKYNAHGATDVGGYGLLGHANNLANIQKNEVGFVIHNLPVIAKMAAVSKACGNMFGLLQGHAAETSGNFWHVNHFFHGSYVVVGSILSLLSHAQVHLFFFV